MMPALTFVAERLLSPRTSPRDSFGVWKEWLWGLGSQRGQGDPAQVTADCETGEGWELAEPTQAQRQPRPLCVMSFSA